MPEKRLSIEQRGIVVSQRQASDPNFQILGPMFHLITAAQLQHSSRQHLSTNLQCNLFDRRWPGAWHHGIMILLMIICKVYLYNCINAATVVYVMCTLH